MIGVIEARHRHAASLALPPRIGFRRGRLGLDCVPQKALDAMMIIYAAARRAGWRVIAKRVRSSRHELIHSNAPIAKLFCHFCADGSALVQNIRKMRGATTAQYRASYSGGATA